MPSSLRLMIIGAEKTGKTVFISRAIFDEYDSRYFPTVTEDSYRKSIVVGFQEHIVDILDVSGAKTSEVHYDRWFSWADSFIFLFSLEDIESFTRIKAFYDASTKVKKEKQGILSSQIPMLLIGTKVDRPRKVTSQMATKMSHVIGCPYYETCSNPFVSKADLFMTDPKKLLTPSEILSKLILEKSRRSLNTVHRDLLKNSSSSKPPEKFSEENLTNMNRSSSKLQGMSVPSLIEELKEKWSKPIDKLPVYIDFPRLAMKVEVIVGEKHQIVKQNQSINPNILKLLSSSPPDFPTASPPSQRLDNKATESKLSSSDDLMKKVDKKLKKSKEKKEKKEKKKKKDDELEITLESRVKVLEKSEWGAGAVRFIGNCKLGSGKWMGIELESPNGNCNGAVKGVTYFNCQDNHGIMLPLKKFTIEPLWIKRPPSDFSGGFITNNYGEEWIFESSGAIKLKDNPSFNYEWDGKFLKPSKDSTSFGAGMWNGEIVSWYKKDWMIFKTSKRDETFRYECKGNSFEPTKPGFPRWILDNKVMKSDTVSGEWYLDELTKVPQVLAILFQLLRYIKVGLDAHNSSTPQPTQVQISSNINNNVPIGPSQPQNQSNSSSIYPIPQELAIPQGKRIKITCQLNNWTFRIPISENATISHLIQEISRRSSRRLVLLEESLSRRRDEILKIMDRLATAVALDDEAEEATMVVRLFVESIKDQIVECQQMAISQTKEIELEASGYCDRLDELLKPMVQITINILKNPEVAYYKDELNKTIKLVTQTLDMMFIFQTEIEVIDLITSDFAALETTDRVTDIEDTVVIAILKRREEDEKTKEEKKRKREALQKRREEEVREREEAARRRLQEELDQQKKEEEEREQKWNEIFNSLKEEETKVEPIVNTNINNNKSNPSLSTTLPPTKSPLIAQVMKEKLSELSEKLGETEQTKLINQEFGKFVTEETGDTARQLAKFLEHVLKEESKLAAVLKAINQSIIATPFIILKRSFPKQLPFEDVSGTWKILVKITPKEEVSVVHQKMGISKANSKEGGYEFCWELVMRFNWDLTKMTKAELEITSITFDSNMSESNRKELQTVVDNFRKS